MVFGDLKNCEIEGFYWDSSNFRTQIRSCATFNELWDFEMRQDDTATEGAEKNRFWNSFLEDKRYIHCIFERNCAVGARFFFTIWDREIIKINVFYSYQKESAPQARPEKARVLEVWGKILAQAPPPPGWGGGCPGHLGI